MTAPAPGPRRRARARLAKAGAVLRRATIRVAEGPHLCRVQAATRELCRSIGAGEGDVFTAVIAVTELAHRLCIEKARATAVSLAIVRRRGGLRLVARAGGCGHAEPAGVDMIIPARGPLFT